MLITLVAGALVLGACGGDDGGDDGATGGGGSADVSVTGTDALAFQPSELSAEAGSITVELTSEEGINHTFVVEEAGDEVVASADPGQTDTGTIELEAGSYTFHCDVPGHRDAGMEGTLTVE
ncbi:MAG TPA: cupredoxin domain-containing protein [Actinomycetota bacterium]